MAKHCETFEHTADVGLAASADTLTELYEALGECLAGQLCRRESVEPLEQRLLEVHSEDVEALAVDFLSRLLGLMQVDGLLVRELSVRMTGEAALEVLVRGEPYDPDRHELGPEIKAVTYHGLRVRREGGQWQGQVVLDL